MRGGGAGENPRCPAAPSPPPSRGRTPRRRQDTLSPRSSGTHAGTPARHLANIGIELSRRLLDLAGRERPLRVEELLRQIVTGTGDPALLDNLEVLFEPELQIDPLALLQSLSRDRTVVASWPGTIFAGQLYYAEPGLPEHRRYPVAELVVVALDLSTEKGTN